MGLANFLTGLIPGRKRQEVKVHHYAYAKREPKPTIRVLMQRDAVGCPDGITRTEYEAGREYDLPEDLAACFFSTGEADPAEAHVQRSNAPEEARQEAAGVDLGAASEPFAETGKSRPRPPRPRRGA